MNTQIYEALENTDISWYCCNCGLPNFNTSLFEDFVELSTPINTTTDTDGSILDISTVFDHVHALLHIWQGYFGARGPGFGWQSFAFNSTSANMYKYELRL
jgi:hypothetical protein